MSHSMQGPRGTLFLYNSDLSGPVAITTHDGATLAVPGDDIVAFVAEYVRRYKISQLEQATQFTVLTGTP